jgi:hypothetical protein
MNNLPKSITPDKKGSWDNKCWKSSRVKMQSFKICKSMIDESSIDAAQLRRCVGDMIDVTTRRVEFSY